MSEQLARPEDLPDFRHPPLNEVLLGVQFAPPKGYQQIRAGEVWNLFRAKFPNVEEHPPLMPVFETFGIFPMSQQLNFGVVTGAQHDRFWFLSPEKDELIQFQQDRLLHNWRKMGDNANEYPRFEKMILNFADEISRFESYIDSIENQKLACNQVEISYINNIILKDSDENNASNWVNFLKFGEQLPDDVACSFRHSILGVNKIPVGRLHCEFVSSSSRGGERMFVLTLTVRGAPQTSNATAAIDFLKMGREVIVNEFAAITTDSAHRLWGRSK